MGYRQIYGSIWDIYRYMGVYGIYRYMGVYGIDTDIWGYMG